MEPQLTGHSFLLRSQPIAIRSPQVRFVLGASVSYAPDVYRAHEGPFGFGNGGYGACCEARNREFVFSETLKATSLRALSCR